MEVEVVHTNGPLIYIPLEVSRRYLIQHNDIIIRFQEDKQYYYILILSKIIITSIQFSMFALRGATI